jgi:hypothetical protein
MKLSVETRKELITLASGKGIFLEGNILKVLEAEDDDQFTAYLDTAIERDTDTRKKRLEIMKQIQEQNKELQRTQEKLKSALSVAEDAKAAVEQDLDTLRKRTQFQLMRRVVGIALGLVVSVGVITTALYVTALVLGKDTDVIGSAWTSTLGILLTNSFSIIGTIMGIKYAAPEKKED